MLIRGEFKTTLSHFLDGFQLSILPPPVVAKNLEFEPILFQTLQNVGLSSGLSHEDAYRHSINFLETCDSHKQKGATPEALQMRASIQTHSSTSEDRSIYLIMNTFYSPL